MPVPFKPGFFRNLNFRAARAGPQKPNLLDVSYKAIQDKMKEFEASKLSRSPMHAKSLWGRLATTMLLENSRPVREFLANLVKHYPSEENNKYATTSLKIIQENCQLLSDEEKKNSNLRQESSIWGYLSNRIYATNNLGDRQFLSTFWAIGLQVAPLDPIISMTPKAGPTGSIAHNILRQKRVYDNQFRLSHPRTPIPQPTLTPQQPVPTPNSNEDLIRLLDAKFSKEVWTFAETPCQVCDCMLYPHQKRTIKVTSTLINMFKEICNEHEFPINNNKKLVVCMRCKSKLESNKIPPKALVNSMQLPPIPSQISELNPAEIRLISRVKAYMQIYLLKNGTGQRAMKGLVVHFPQQISEPLQQLPINPQSADIIIVNETGDRLEHPTELVVRPRQVYAALAWLLENNPKYCDIIIDQSVSLNQIPSISLTPSQVAPVEGRLNYEANQVTYVPIGSFSYNLRASFHQGHQMFLRNAGTQCTAMAASFLAHAFIDSPDQWCRQTLDDVILLGNDYYTIKRAARGDIPLLTSDEVQGEISAFNGVPVKLEINHSPECLEISMGYGNRANGADLPRIKQRLQQFIDNGFQYGIITMNGASVGICVYDEFTYLFDSHSRGPRGGRSAAGTACILKVENSQAPKVLSHTINRNYTNLSANPDELNSHLFTLTVFDVTRVPIPENDEIDENGEPERVPTPPPPEMPSPRRKIPRVEFDSGSDSDSDPIDNDDEGNTFNDIGPLPTVSLFGRVMDNDCVIERDDPVEPHVDSILRRDLKRVNNSPVNERLEKDLDLLAFPHLFPHGRNGLTEDSRKIPITPLDYFQQRLMSSDPRFNGNSEFLFYALSQTDKHRARQKIAVCCAQTRQVPNPEVQPDQDNLAARDPHVYMSSIRGTSSYWKQYTGDLIAMVKSLGVPTFFFTFSYDDINSADCINALWKAKNGPNTPDIDPQEIPYLERKALLNDYPIIAARHFSMRLSKFLALIKANGEQIFGLPLADYSIRVEFQQRGSPHAHCLFWLEGAPTDWSSPEGIRLLEKNVSCSTNTPYRDLVLKYQRHNHSQTCYKNSRGRVCRFGFPRMVSPETRILSEDEIVRNKGRFFVGKRAEHEKMIGYYHPILFPILRCNQDCSPVTGAVAIAYYIAKYMSKAEPVEIRRNIQDAITGIQNSNLPLHQRAFNIAMLLMRNREVSAQEAGFRICHLSLRQSSRATVFVPTFKKERRVRMLKREAVAQGIPDFCTNIMDRYMARPTGPSWQNMCLYEFATTYAPLPKSLDTGNNDDDVIEFPEGPPIEVVGKRIVHHCRTSDGRVIGKFFRREKPAVIKTPNFHPISDKDAYYYSLLLLYLPFREENFADGQGDTREERENNSPVKVFQRRHAELRKHSDNPCLRMDLADEIDRALLRVTEFDELDNQDVDLERPFDMPYEEPELGNDVPSPEEVFRPRPQDPNLIERIRALYNGLNSEQRVLFEKVRSALRTNRKNLRQLVLANAGTGKSHCLKLLSLLIKSHLSDDSILIAAPTGKAAFPIGASTNHRVFGLPIQHGFIKPYEKLSPAKLAEFRRLYRNVSWIFLDEISMVGYDSFRTIHLRLCEIFETDGTEPFAGKNVILWGDLLQLPPPKAARIFKKPAIYAAERDLWNEFDFNELTINMRQGNDPLGKICDELRVGALTEESLRLLKTRLLYPNGKNNPDKGRLDFFKDAIRVFPENSLCDAYNNERTKQIAKSTVVFKISACDEYADGIKVGQACPETLIPKKLDSTGGLPSVIKLAVGSRVMLRRNIDTLSGHVNGATGVVKQIIFGVDNGVPMHSNALPRKVLVKYDHEDHDTWVEPMDIDFSGKRGVRIKRRMLPFILCWACTAHKLQGATLDKAVVYLGVKCRTKGLAYVTISRVKTLAGLAIIDLAPEKLLTSKKWNPADTEAIAELERLRAKRGDIAVQNNLNANYNNLFPTFDIMPPNISNNEVSYPPFTPSAPSLNNFDF